MSKSLAKNSLYLVLYRLLTVLFPLVTVSYASHIIFSDGIGRVASAQNIVQYFVLIAGLGIPNYGIREVSKVRQSGIDVNKLFTELISINTISTFLCLLIYYILVRDLSVYETDPLLYNIIGLTVFLNFFNVDWFYQGNEEFAYIAKRSFLVKLLSLFLLLTFVNDKDDYVVYASINLFGVAGNNILNCYNLKKYKVRFQFQNLQICRHLKPIFILLSTTIAIELYTMVDTTMLTFMCTSSQVAYYTNSIKIVRLLVIFVTSIGGVLLPRLSYYKFQGMMSECENVVNRVFSYMFLLLIPCGVGLYFLSGSLVRVLFGQSFIGGIHTMEISSILVFALGFSNLFGTQVLLTFNEEKKLLYATLLGAISNLILNVILIPLYDQNGAVIASIVSEVLVTLFTYYYAKKHLRIRLEKKGVTSILLSTLFMAILLYSLKSFVSNELLYILLGSASGAVVYFATLLMLRNSFFLDLLSVVKLNFIHK